MAKQIRIAVLNYDGVPLSIRIIDNLGQHVGEQIVGGTLDGDEALFFHVHQHQAIIIAEVGDQPALAAPTPQIEADRPGLPEWPQVAQRMEPLAIDHDAAIDDGGIVAGGGDDVRRVE